MKAHICQISDYTGKNFIYWINKTFHWQEIYSYCFYINNVYIIRFNTDAFIQTTCNIVLIQLCTSVCAAVTHLSLKVCFFLQAHAKLMATEKWFVLLIIMSTAKRCIIRSFQIGWHLSFSDLAQVIKQWSLTCLSCFSETDLDITP